MSLSAILFSFKGRINRAKFWMVRLLLPIGIVRSLIIVGVIVDLISRGASEAGFVTLLLYGIFCVWVWASLAVTVKRWHDCDRSGWWILIELIPIIGDILVFVVLGFCKGTAGPNRFGPDPLKKQ